MPNGLTSPPRRHCQPPSLAPRPPPPRLPRPAGRL